MDYRWLESHANPLLRWHNTAVAPKFSKDGVIQYYLFGDGSKSTIAVVLRNGGEGDMWRHSFITLNWVGWKLIRWDMTKDPTANFLVGSNSALPSGDVLNLSCFAIYPAPVEERLFETSSIYFSQLEVIKLGDYIHGTGIKELSIQPEINVYTTNDYIEIASSDAIKAVKVYSIAGALVKSVQPQQVLCQIPTNNLTPGVYIVKITTDTSQKNVKVFVQ
jgi:hypothetical protein